MTITYRPIIDPVDFDAVVDLHETVWGGDARESTPAHMLLALQHAGGLILGAYDQDRLAGFVYGFPGIRDGKALHWSHAAGVDPAYQGRGLGTGLKLLQREHVLVQGYDCIAWTFDPLQRGNANFNIHRLGCLCNIYHLDLYGELQDGLNEGLPSDRFETRWWISDRHVTERIAGFPASRQEIFHFLLTQTGNQSGMLTWSDGIQQVVAVEIPWDINCLRETKLDIALDWRLRTRETFVRLFAEGFTVNDFVQDSETRRCFYLLANHV